MAIDSTVPRTRRAILLGALGGAVAVAATAIDRASPVKAGTDDPLVLGHNDNAADKGTLLTVTGTNSVAFAVVANETGGSRVAINGQGAAAGSGVAGFSPQGTGVNGASSSGSGVHGESYTSGYGVVGEAHSPGKGAGVRGIAPAGRGAILSGGLAQLRLVPSAAMSHPTSGALGDLFLDKLGRLSLCKGGTTWVRLA